MAERAWQTPRNGRRSVAGMSWMRKLAHALSCAVLLGTTFPTSGLAESPVGEAIVAGKRVTLFSDGTWQYKETGLTDCKTVTKRITFCPADPAWQPSPPQTPSIAAAFRHDDRKFGQYVVEELGTADGLTMNTLREAVLSIARNATGAEPAIIMTTETRVSDLPAETVVYAVSYGDVAVVFSNTLLLTDKIAAQIQTYEVGTSDYTDAHRKTHDDFVSATRIRTE